MTDATLPKTPALDAQRHARETLHTEAIGTFIDWASEHGLVLCERRPDDADSKEWPSYMAYIACHRSIESILAEYAGVDSAAVERERMMLLDYLRAPKAVP